MSIDQDKEQQVKRMAWNMLEEQVFGWIEKLRDRIHSKRAGQWKAGDEARKQAKAIEDSGNAEAAIEDAIQDVNEQFNRLLVKYAQQHQNPQMDTQELTGELQDFIVKLHSPETREVLLLGVKEEYRDDYRNWISQLGSAYWGLVDMANGDVTDDFWHVMNVYSAVTGQSVQQIAEQAEGVSPADVPSELR